MFAFLLWCIVVIVVMAIVIIGVKWLMGLAGVQIPPPLLAIAGLILFLVLLFALWHFVGSAAFDMPHHLH